MEKEEYKDIGLEKVKNVFRDYTPSDAEVSAGMPIVNLGSVLSLTLWLGRKQLRLTYNHMNHTFTDQLDNVSDMKVEDETTRIYAEAINLVKTCVNATGNSITYAFKTSHPTLLKWAEDKGRTLFGWDDVFDYGEAADYRYEYTKEFSPYDT